MFPDGHLGVPLAIVAGFEMPALATRMSRRSPNYYSDYAAYPDYWDWGFRFCGGFHGDGFGGGGRRWPLRESMAQHGPPAARGVGGERCA
jgi:hypothetical protein